MSEILNNSKYIHPGIVLANLQMAYKGKQFFLDDIIELCARCETNYIGDLKTMVPFQDIGISVINGMAKRPCNIYRIEDIFDSNSEVLFAADNGSYLYNIKYRDGRQFTGDTIYLNYAGIPVDNDGIPLIAAGHEEACETFCKVKLFEEDVANGLYSPQMWNMLDMKFSGQIVAAQNSWRHHTRADIDKRHIIRGNMLQKIGQLSIKSKEFEE